MMIFKYDIHTTENLILAIQKATEENKTYIKGSVRQYGKRYVFQMEDDSVSEQMASVSIIDNGDQLDSPFEDVIEDSHNLINKEYPITEELPKDSLEDNEKAKEEMDAGAVEPFVKRVVKTRKPRTKKTTK